MGDPIRSTLECIFLGLVLKLADDLEAARLPTSTNTVFSYRYKTGNDGSLFDEEFGWRQFIETSNEAARSCEYVVVCDISEFYPRLGHHSLENALKQLNSNAQYVTWIIEFLSNFSKDKSYGLPIGGPASRLLSELVLNQVDRLLYQSGFKFCRFADDYHLFVDSLESAYRVLAFLSEKLFLNLGLSLQKSKTRILSKAEFLASSPLPIEQERQQTPAASQRLLNLAVRFDPYSPTAEDDYERLKKEINSIDIIPILRDELTKSRIHTPLARKLIKTISFLDLKDQEAAVLTLLDSCELLYPVWSSVLILLQSQFKEFSEETQTLIIGTIHRLIKEKSHVMQLDIHIAYALRVLQFGNSPENVEVLNTLYGATKSAIVRRDVMLIMANLANWYWLADIQNRFTTMTAIERRAFIVCSYFLSDQGQHWRKNNKDMFSPFETLIRDWASEKKQANPSWRIPL